MFLWSTKLLTSLHNPLLPPSLMQPLFPLFHQPQGIAEGVDAQYNFKPQTPPPIPCLLQLAGSFDKLASGEILPHQYRILPASPLQLHTPSGSLKMKAHGLLGTAG